MGIFGKMEESGKQRQTNLKIVRGNPIGVVFVCGHDEKKKKTPEHFTTLDTKRKRRGKKIHRVRP